MHLRLGCWRAFRHVDLNFHLVSGEVISLDSSNAWNAYSSWLRTTPPLLNPTSVALQTSSGTGNRLSAERRLRMRASRCRFVDERFVDSKVVETPDSQSAILMKIMCLNHCCNIFSYFITCVTQTNVDISCFGICAAPHLALA